jgi:hypothetical protein
MYAKKKVFNGLLRPTLQLELHKITKENKHTTLMVLIRPRALAMLLVAPDALHGDLLPVHP